MSWFEPYGVWETGGAKTEQKAWKEENNVFLIVKIKGYPCCHHPPNNYYQNSRVLPNKEHIQRTEAEYKKLSTGMPHAWERFFSVCYIWPWTATGLLSLTYMLSIRNLLFLLWFFHLHQGVFSQCPNCMILKPAKTLYKVVAGALPK